MLLAFDREPEPLLEVLGVDRGLGREPAAFLDDDLHPAGDRRAVLERRRPDLHRPRIGRWAPSGPELAKGEDREGVRPGERRRRAREPVRASTRSGSSPRGVAARRRSAISPRAGAALAEGGEAPGAPRGRRRPGSSSGQSSEGVIPNRPRGGEPQQGPRAAGIRARTPERPHRPGRRRVEVRVGATRLTRPLGPRTAEPAAAGAGARSRFQVVAGVFLLVVGQPAPGRRSGRDGDPDGAGGGSDPAGGVPLGGPPVDRPAGDRRTARRHRGRGRSRKPTTRRASALWPAAERAIATVAASRGQT